jgi:hypothetical protein
VLSNGNLFATVRARRSFGRAFVVLVFPVVNVFGVPLSDAAMAAAIVGAVLGGAFSLSKEVFAFFLRWLENRAAVKRQRRAVYGRLAQHYFQMGVGAWKALEAWRKASQDIAALEGAAGLDTGGTPAPDMIFLSRYDDPQLATDVLQLADEDPDAVTAYMHALTIRDRAPEVRAEEVQEFATVRFSYPRTRTALTTLMEHTAASLRRAATHLPQRVRKTLEQGAGQIAAALPTFPKVSLPDVLKEATEARQRLKGLR